MKKKLKVVMLPTEIRATTGDIIIGHDNELIIFEHVKCTKNKQHLYLVSDDEIKEGDWVISFNELYQVKELIAVFTSTAIDGNIDGFTTECGTSKHFTQAKKIIATTDKSLFLNEEKAILHPQSYAREQLPKIPESFIKEFVKSNGKIDEVEVEYDEDEEHHPELDDCPIERWEILKLTPNNEVIISPVEDMIPFEAPAGSLVLSPLSSKERSISLINNWMNNQHQDKMYSREDMVSFAKYADTNSLVNWNNKEEVKEVFSKWIEDNL